MTTHDTQTRETDLLPFASLLHEAGVPLPVLPPQLARALAPQGAHAFATPGWKDVGSLEALAHHWLAHPTPERAWVGFTGHGLQRSAVRVCIATAAAAFFIERRWTEVFEQGPLLRRRLEGAFQLLAQALEDVAAVQAAGAWPAGKRLLLIDDDFDRQRWGWVTTNADLARSLQSDGMSYLSLLVSLDGLKKQQQRPSQP
jgi:hypothetical protein